MKITSSQFWAVLFFLFSSSFSFTSSLLVWLKYNKIDFLPFLISFLRFVCFLFYGFFSCLVGWLVTGAGWRLGDQWMMMIMVAFSYLKKSGSGIVCHYMGSETVVFLILFNFFKIH